MAIVQQYPLKTPKNSDLLVGTSIPDPNTNDDPKTSSFSISSIGSFLTTQNNIITGGGTLNTIPLFTPDGQRIDDSIITQNALGTVITVNGDLTLNGALTVDDVATFNDALTVQGGLVANDPVTINAGLTVYDLTTLDAGLTVEGSSTFYNDTTFEDTAVFQQDIGDNTSSSGTPGQVLSSTGSGVMWIDNLVLTSPGGTDYRIVVGDDGVLSTVEV
jgi:hypothetical protein